MSKEFQVLEREYFLGGGEGFLCPATTTSHKLSSCALRADRSGQIPGSPKPLRHLGAAWEVPSGAPCWLSALGAENPRQGAVLLVSTL